MVGKVEIKWVGGYHPSMGKDAKDPTLEQEREICCECGHPNEAPGPMEGMHGRADTQQVIDILVTALRRSPDNWINDVTTEHPVIGRTQIILTTDDGSHKQVWVIDEDGIRETDPPEPW